LATLGETVALVAHEIKNMVIPMRGFLRRIRESHALTDKASSYLEIVERESAKLEKMTQDMLCFARQMPLQREEIEVDSLFEEVRQALQEEFRKRGVRLACSCDVLVPCLINCVLFFGNLIFGNAISCYAALAVSREPLMTASTNRL